VGESGVCGEVCRGMGAGIGVVDGDGCCVCRQQVLEEASALSGAPAARCQEL
jgi:hypothetical protein